jgi:hypothetical protein
VVTDRLAQAVRRQLGLGRLVPLGAEADGAWLTERAAEAVLRRAADAVPGVRLGGLRIALADPDAAGTPAVPPPPSALPPGPLRIEAECGATADEPLPVTAERLREALLGASADRLGLAVEAVDLRVTEVLDELPPPRQQPPQQEPHPEPRGAEPPQSHPPDSEPPHSEPSADGPDAAIAAVVTAVPGVARLAPVLGFPRPVHISGSHIQVELAVAAGHRALDVARAVRAEVAAAAPTSASVPAPVTVAVLVTAVEQDDR